MMRMSLVIAGCILAVGCLGEEFDDTQPQVASQVDYQLPADVDTQLDWRDYCKANPRKCPKPNQPTRIQFELTRYVIWKYTLR